MGNNFEFKPLMYTDDYLVPILSEATIRHHYYGHYRNYINTLNKLIEVQEPTSIKQVIENSYGKLYNTAAQVWNHEFYFNQLTIPSNRKILPTGKLKEMIDISFGSYDEFLAKFKKEGLSVFGSGWVWLVCEYDSWEMEDRLVIKTTSNAGIPRVFGPRGRILMTLDLWEHAYYLDYPNDRESYIDNFFNILDWNVIEDRLLNTTRIKFEFSDMAINCY